MEENEKMMVFSCILTHPSLSTVNMYLKKYRYADIPCFRLYVCVCVRVLICVYIMFACILSLAGRVQGLVRFTPSPRKRWPVGVLFCSVTHVAWLDIKLHAKGHEGTMDGQSAAALFLACNHS